jgi:two-component system phosphate regulon sensor histidine kinase PhoR
MAFRWGSRRPGAGILVRFALTSLLVFVVIGVAFALVRGGDVREREERAAAARAELIAVHVVGPMVQPSDLDRPIRGERYTELRRELEAFIRADGRIERIKIWGTDGTILFSDDPEQVGSRPEIEEDLREAYEGEVASEISSLEEAENRSERKLADRLFETYVPLRSEPGGPVHAVVEVYQDYSAIQAEIDAFEQTLTVSLGIGLLLLYVALLPVAVGVTRTLRRQNERLHEQATQLETLLEREQQTVAELVELDRLKSDFVAAASHELRTPLTSIRGYVHVLRQTRATEDPFVRDGLAAIDRQTGRLSRLIGNLLREGRLEGPDDAPEVQSVDVAELVRHLRQDFHEGGKRISIEIPDDLPPIPCDGERLVEILTNLVDNALKYSPPDAPVEIGASVQDDTLSLWVRDRGVGIAENELSRIFERFYQADQTATRPFGGVGLGLHIVHGLVDGMGGRIDVESREGEGSTFTVRIPFRLVPGETQSETPSLSGSGRE